MIIIYWHLLMCSTEIQEVVGDHLLYLEGHRERELITELLYEMELIKRSVGVCVTE